MSRKKPTLEHFLPPSGLPQRIWLAPDAGTVLEKPLRKTFLEGDIIPFSPTPDGPPLQGPAILVMTDKDMDSPQRALLLQAAQRAKPGRPVIYGGSQSTDTVLEAINIWQAFRMLPMDTPSEAVMLAVRRAHEAMSMEVALEMGADRLRLECRRLNGVIEELRATQNRLLHTARLATVGRITGTLKDRVEEQFKAMEAFEESMKVLEHDQRLYHLMGITMEGVRSVGTLIKDMSALTENRDEEVTLKDEELDPLVKRAVSFLQHDSALLKRILRLSLKSETKVCVDRYRMYLVLMNFIRNAVQATEPRDLIEVRTFVRGDQAVIEVQDCGCGMTPDVHERIFTPFFTTKGSEGTGLGLRLCLTTIERQGGTLECDSAPGKGTCFRILLPAVS